MRIRTIPFISPPPPPSSPPTPPPPAPSRAPAHRSPRAGSGDWLYIRVSHTSRSAPYTRARRSHPHAAGSVSLYSIGSTPHSQFRRDSICNRRYSSTRPPAIAAPPRIAPATPGTVPVRDFAAPVVRIFQCHVLSAASKP